MTLAYVAGPYSHGDTARNIRLAVIAAAELDLHGIRSHVPHRCGLDEFLGYDRPYESWLAEGCDILSRCDAVLLLPGKSPGAEVETKVAKRAGIPVFEDVSALIAFHREREAKAGAA